ncbi:MAG TPA: hypothetical protein VGP46_02845 [Acidimicrobiales bacterium]|nr:hypothetical protein [Acidimicrobiales bacterium]
MDHTEICFAGKPKLDCGGVWATHLPESQLRVGQTFRVLVVDEPLPGGSEQAMILLPNA